MRRRENCLNSTVDLRIQDKSYTNHIMTLRRVKPSIETSQPETPLRFLLHQEVWEKNREENIERSNLLQTRTQFSKIKNYNEQNNKSVSFTGITARSTNSSQSKNRPSTSYSSSSKIYNKSSSRLQNNFHFSESQVFLTQTNIKPKAKPKPRNKSKIDVFLSNTPPNQWKEISTKDENENDDDHNIKKEPKRKKIERSPYRPAANKVLKMQKIVSNQFNKRYLRTEMSLRKSSNMNSEVNFETDSECVANITDDTLTSENSILKNASFLLHTSTSENAKEVNKKTDNLDDDIDEDFEKFDDEKDTSDEPQNEIINSGSKKSIESSSSTATNDQIKLSDHSNDDTHPENKKKRKKVIRKKIRKVRVIHQPKNDDSDDDLHEINLSDT